jgi:ketosteroid isomerase-like protein
MEDTAQLGELKERFIEARPAAPALALHQVVIHVDGDTAVVSGRTSQQRGTYRCYLDTYERRADGWRWVHAFVWLEW